MKVAPSTWTYSLLHTWMTFYLSLFLRCSRDLHDTFLCKGVAGWARPVVFCHFSFPFFFFLFSLIFYFLQPCRIATKVFGYDAKMFKSPSQVHFFLFSPLSVIVQHDEQDTRWRSATLSGRLKSDRAGLHGSSVYRPVCYEARLVLQGFWWAVRHYITVILRARVKQLMEKALHSNRYVLLNFFRAQNQYWYT